MAQPTEKTKKTNRLSSYFKGVRSELRKVIWPNRKELTNYTGVVLFMSVLAAIVVYLLDLIVGGALSLIIS
ncbi:MAG: preprotein translocase subunit SecE [Tissierellales bacterium]|jgi:preprotein translocase subunit SecE|nr:preprotein translocase subunit SecE [Tissierellales bacterium]